MAALARFPLHRRPSASESSVSSMESCVSRLIRLSCLVALIFTFAPAPALFAETSELITAPLNTLTQETELSGLEKVFAEEPVEIAG